MSPRQLYARLSQHAKDVFAAILYFKLRLRYPISLPSDIGRAVGFAVDDTIVFEELIERLTCGSCSSTNLVRYMSRTKAEQFFSNASRVERFCNSTLCSYCFSEGWIELELSFDENDRLRRLFIHHKSISNAERLEICLRRQD